MVHELEFLFDKWEANKTLKLAVRKISNVNNLICYSKMDVDIEHSLILKNFFYYHLLICFSFLLNLCVQQARVHLLDTEPFQGAFGPKGKRKRPKLLAADYESLVKRADGSRGKSLLLLSLWCFFSFS